MVLVKVVVLFSLNKALYYLVCFLCVVEARAESVLLVGAQLLVAVVLKLRSAHYQFFISLQHILLEL